MTEQLRARPRAHALLDTENLFFPFGRRLSSLTPENLPKAKERLALLFPAVPVETALTLADVAVQDFIDWIENRYRLVTKRSFGKRSDDGVHASLMALGDRGFALTVVPSGPDEADKAVAETAELLAWLPGTSGHIVLGGEDHLVCDKARNLHCESDGSWSFLVVIPSTASKQWAKFKPGGTYETLRVTALNLIRQEQRGVRQNDLQASSAHRRVVVNSLRLYTRPIGTSPSTRYVAAVQAVVQAVGLPSTPEELDGRWRRGVTARLTATGLDRRIAEGILSWVAENRQESVSSGLTSTRELLFLAAVDVCLEGHLNEGVATATREYVAANHPEQLNLLERSLAAALSPR